MRRIIHKLNDIIHQIRESALNLGFIHHICHWHRSSEMVNLHQVASTFVVSFTRSLTSFIRSEYQHQISALFIVSVIGIVHQQW